MTTLPDLIFVALFAVVGPLVGYTVFWPAFRRLARVDPAWARGWLWKSTIAEQWTLVAFGAALWVAHDRSWASFGFAVPGGWRLWAAVALIVLPAVYYALAARSVAHNPVALAGLRGQLEPIRAVMPHTRGELAWFGGVSLTAGFCEEFLFRGYFIWAFTPWLGWWGAAALALAVFALLHIYQGWGGVLRTGVVGAVFTLTVAVFDSLWPAIVLHALVDLCNGFLAWLGLRGGPPAGGVAGTEQPTEPRPAAEVRSGDLG